MIITMSTELTDVERTILDIELLWWQYAGLKESAIRERLDMTTTRYYQVLNALIDTERAMAAEPNLVKRLQSKRAERQLSRSLRRTA